MTTQWERPAVLFKANPLKAALVVIDMQNFACAPAVGPAWPNLTEVVGRINDLAASCRESGVPVIWVRHVVDGNGGLYSLFHSPEGNAAVADRAHGSQLFPQMRIDGVRDHFVRKNRYSAFMAHPPELRQKLDALGRGQLIIAGVVANVCVESTVRDAMQLGYEVILAADAVTGPDVEAVRNTLNNTRLFFGDVRNSAEIGAELAEGRHGGNG